jgi:hypothetical protein
LKQYQRLIKGHQELEIAQVSVGWLLRSGWDTKPIGPELYHEHGKTLNRMARLATAAMVLQERYDNGDPHSAGYALKHEYTKAHEQLQKGDANQGLMEIEVNALTAARHEILFGGTGADVKEWLGRAAYALTYTVEHDQTNLASAILIMSERMRHLHSRNVAEASVLKRP